MTAVLVKNTQAGLSSLHRVAQAAQRLINGAGSWFASITSLASLIMILTGTLDVLGTGLFNAPLPATYESTESLMVALVFGGLAYAQVRNRHIRVEFLTQRMPPKWRTGFDLLGLLMGLVFFVLFSYAAWDLFWGSWLIRESESSGVRFPIYPAKFIMFSGSVLVTLQLFTDTVKGVRSWIRQ